MFKLILAKVIVDQDIAASDAARLMVYIAIVSSIAFALIHYFDFHWLLKISIEVRLNYCIPSYHCYFNDTDVLLRHPLC